MWYVPVGKLDDGWVSWKNHVRSSLFRFRVELTEWVLPQSSRSRAADKVSPPLAFDNPLAFAHLDFSFFSCLTDPLELHSLPQIYPS